MRPGRSSADRRRRRTRRHARLDRVAVAVLAALTVLLWVVAIPLARDTLTRAGRADAVSAQVAQCSQDRILAPPCEVTFELQGASVTRALHQGTLFGVEPGERIEVYPLDDGTAAIGGWRASADAALLVLLALALTSYTLGRWTRLPGPVRGRRGEPGRTADDSLRRDADPASGRGSRAHPAA